MSKKVYQKEIRVTEDHLDDLAHVNNVTYLYWVQDMAREHWNSVVSPEISEKYYWIVTEHKIKYRGEAKLGDVIQAKTYIDGYQGVRSDRIVEFYLGDRLIVSARTTWCMMDRERNRPARIEGQMIADFL